MRRRPPSRIPYALGGAAVGGLTGVLVHSATTGAGWPETVGWLTAIAFLLARFGLRAVFAWFPPAGYAVTVALGVLAGLGYWYGRHGPRGYPADPL